MCLPAAMAESPSQVHFVQPAAAAKGLLSLDQKLRFHLWYVLQKYFISVQ